MNPLHVRIFGVRFGSKVLKKGMIMWKVHTAIKMPVSVDECMYSTLDKNCDRPIPPPPPEIFSSFKVC